MLKRISKVFTFQGIFLAILYCFLNSEVQEVAKRSIERTFLRYDVRWHRGPNTAEMTEMRFATLQRRPPQPFYSPDAEPPLLETIDCPTIPSSEHLPLTLQLENSETHNCHATSVKVELNFA